MDGFTTVHSCAESLRIAALRKRGSTALVSGHIKPEHNRMSRMLGYCLMQGEPDSWARFATVAQARLTVLERAALVVASLRSLPEPYASDVAMAALCVSDEPLPAVLGGMAHARDWAAYATLPELKAMLTACFEKLPPKEQNNFYRFIGEIEVKA